MWGDLSHTTQLDHEPIHLWLGLQRDHTMDPNRNFLVISKFDAESSESRAAPLAPYERVGTHNHKRRNAGVLQPVAGQQLPSLHPDEAGTGWSSS